jgi:hypothetical protein
MLGLRQFIRARRLSGVFAAAVAYALFVQLLMASVGLGMSAAEVSGQDGLSICSFAAGPNGHGSTKDDDRQDSPAPQCPFCFLAAQGAHQAATLAQAPAYPAYAGFRIVDGLSRHVGDRAYVPHFRRTTGDPRAPPTSAV